VKYEMGMEISDRNVGVVSIFLEWLVHDATLERAASRSRTPTAATRTPTK
jgi:hypothetical protein